MTKNRWLIIAVVVVIIAIPASVWVYANVIEDDAPERLALETATTIAGQTAGTLPEVKDGNWAPTADSQVGYRVKEKLFNQDIEAVGRTNKVTGTLTLAGKTVTAVDLSVDVASITSDQANRDNQFRGRIMNTSTHPTATFKLTQPINLLRLPDATAQEVKATGNLTLRGVAKAVAVDLKVAATSRGIEVNGAIPINFGEWDIPNPSFGPASVGDDGELELLVVFAAS